MVEDCLNDLLVVAIEKEVANNMKVKQWAHMQSNEFHDTHLYKYIFLLFFDK